MNENNKKTQDIVIKGPKGEFDVSTAEGKAQLEGYLKALSETSGRLAQEKDVAQKERDALQRQYDLSSANVDITEAKKRAAEMRDQGASDQEMDGFWIEFNQQSVKQASKGNQFDLLWSDYKNQRPGVFNNMNTLEQDMYKNHVRQTYLNRLQAEQNQFQFLDQIFEDKIKNSSNVSTPQEPTQAPAVLGGSSQSAPQRPAEAPTEAPKDLGAWDEETIKLYESMGWKIK